MNLDAYYRANPQWVTAIENPSYTLWVRLYASVPAKAAHRRKFSR